jgi:protein-glutamine gamma-glutamyltransferase
VDSAHRIRVAPILLAAAFLIFSAWHWARLEQPHMSGDQLLLLSLLAAVPTLAALLLRSRTATAIAAALAAVVAIGQIMHTWPWQTRHGLYPSRVIDLVVRGLRDWFGTHTPIDAGRFAGADRDLRLAFFLGAAALVWLVVRRGAALPGIGVAFAMFALPSTVLPLGANGFRAGVFLLLALLTLVVTSRRTGRPLAGDAQVVGMLVAVVLAGLVVGTAPGVTKNAFLDWQTWNPLAQQGPLVSVDYMWNQTYAPLHWPKKRTTVLQVQSNTEMYWKAATLNTFLVDHWAYSAPIGPLETSTGGDFSVSDLPLEESVNTKLVPVNVKVLGLADNHLVGAGQPVHWSLPSGVESLLGADGTVSTLDDVPRNATYKVSVYNANPTLADLTTAGNEFPDSVRASILIGGTQIPAWPARLPRNVQVLDRPFMAASQEVWKASHAKDAHKNEYEAVYAVEHYFRSKPFRYSLTPNLSGRVPALAEFMLHTHAGYCQMFSGAMALVLRLHGIPARVAVGFTPGKLHGSDTYVVNDRDAHAWVEVYFPSWGWIPFEPTPGSHLPTDTSSSSPKFAQIRTGGSGAIPPGLQKFFGQVAAGPAGPHTAAQGANFARIHGGIGGAVKGGSNEFPGAGGGGSHGRFITWLFTLTLVVLAAVLVVKTVTVRWRYLRRGPRARAAAAYHDLATFVGDQGLVIRPDDTFTDLATRLQDTFGVDAAAFAQSATIARYASLTAAEPEGRQLRRQVRRVKHDVRERLTARERATGAFRLRTLLSQATLGS